MSANGMTKEDLSFEINEDQPDLVEKYYFVVDEQGEPLKLGDGTFGVIYQVQRGNAYFAVKLLYDNESLQAKSISEMDTDQVILLLEEVLRDLGLLESKKTKEISEIVKRYHPDPDQLAVELEGQNIEQWKEILIKLREKAKSTAIERFKRESKVTEIIRENRIRKGQQTEDIGGTVEVLGGTKHFKTSSAYKTLKKSFVRSGITLSDYALVMTKYNFSLKDLLEKGPGKKQYGIRRSILLEIFKGTPPEFLTRFEREKSKLEEQIDKRLGETTSYEEITGEHKKQLKEAIIEMVGYELLKEMSFDERIRTALPFLHHITTGLMQLHEVEQPPLFHLDVKPANIFVRPDRAQGLVCVLGDIGYIEPERIVVQSKVGTLDELPLGTLHYRSPEQKEYFDIANVEVVIEEQRVILNVPDPKFKGSFIETGDIIYFSKDRLRYPYPIEEIVPGSPGHPTRIYIAAHENMVNEGELTQVVLRKKQRHRTDLFGIGAIAFDLITCGMSSERFYENIRRFEFSDDGMIPGDIDTIMEKYQRVVDGQAQADEPSLIQIFEPFKHHARSNYAPPEIVRLILKCMLYKANNTFFAPYASKDNPGSKPVEDVRSHINELRRQYNDPRVDYFHANPLITLEIKRETGQEASQLSKIIDNLQEVQSSPLLRLAQGVFYFDKLALLVRDSSSQGEGIDPSFLYQMLPNMIRWNPGSHKFEFSYPVYKTPEDYLEDLRHGGMTKMLRNPSNPFVPYHLAFMRRDIKLTRIAGAISNTKRLVFHYAFLDASLYGDKLTEDDWVVIRDTKSVWKAVNVDKESRQLTLEWSELSGHNEDGLEWEIPASIQAEYFANLNPCKYYLEMLAIYLHNLFLCHSPITKATRDKIDMYTLLLQKPNVKGIRKNNLGNWPRIVLRAEPQVLYKVFESIAKFHLKLIWHDSEDSYYGGGDSKNYQSIYLRVHNGATELRNQVEELFGAEKNSFEHNLPDSGDLQSLREKGTLQFGNIDKELEAISKDPLDFEKILKDLLY